MRTDREQHTLVADYLRRLDAESRRRLPADRAAELVEDLRAHLTEAVPPGATEAQVRTALERVGDPVAVVDEAAGAAAPPAAGTGTPASNRLEVAALICLVGSLVLFPLVPLAALLLLAGLVLLLLSRRWGTGDKVLGALAYTVLGAPLLVVAGFGVATISSSRTCVQEPTSDGDPAAPVCTTSGTTLPPWLLLTLVGGWLAFQAYVAVRLSRRARLEQA